MTDDTPENTPQEKGKNNTARNAALGAAATIGSAAIAAALLYAGKRFRNNPNNKATGADHSGTVPSGEPPETD